MNRAYNIKVNGKVVRTVGGKKAGRFATTTPVKTRKSLRKRHNRKQRHILAPLIPILWILLIATGCTGYVELNEAQQPLTAEPVKAEIETTTGSFESADIPADYVEETVTDKIYRIFGTEAQKALAVFKCESNLDPNVIGDTNTKYPSVGVAQIRLLPERNLKVADMLDADKNLEYAHNLFLKSGWKPWACREAQ